MTPQVETKGMTSALSMLLSFFNLQWSTLNEVIKRSTSHKRKYLERLKFPL